MYGGVPAAYIDAVTEHREALLGLVERAKAVLAAGDLPALWVLAGEIERRLAGGNDVTGGHLRGEATADVVEELDEVYDSAFPVRNPDDAAGVLDTPWPTERRRSLLAGLIEHPGARMPSRVPLVARAVAAGDVRLLRLLVRSPVGQRLDRDTIVRVLDALYSLGALDTELVEHALLTDSYLGYAVAGRSPIDGAVTGQPAACLGAVRDGVDALIWQLTGAAEPVNRGALPLGLAPRGLRFVRRALEWPADREGTAVLGAADLTATERAELAGYLRDRPEEERLRAFRLRLPAGDAWALLPVLGLAGAEPLFALVRAASTPHPVRQDLAAILAAAERAGVDRARRLLELCPSELVEAALGRNRPAVERRVKRNALGGIAAYGLLPLADGESVLDRYLVLREVATRGSKLGPNRRHSHAAAVAVALDHLAQVGGYPDASRLELACEARVAADAPGESRIGDYLVAVRMAGADAVITVSRAGRPLKSVPAAVRADPRYAELRRHQERLRDQARRLRSSLIERLVTDAGTLEPDELAELRDVPSVAAMLSALIWSDWRDTIGLLDEVELDGPVTAVHPYQLYRRGLLGHWQAEVVRRRLQQPVKQAFRELYLLTPAEREAGDRSRRFAGHTVNGKVAGQLLSGRGWSTHGEYDEYQATRPVGGGFTAALQCGVHGYFGLGEVAIGELRFLAGGMVTPLAGVPPVAFSEVMRDLDLVVSVAASDPAGHTSPPHTQSRAELLSALADDLGLSRVHVDGGFAVVRGTRATYRVHLGSGSIHLEPGGHLCLVPASFGGTAHQDLFLPFADEDRMTSVILSKVLLLNEDEKITDPGILSQLDARH
ncbi:MAG: DUF4132 domain-containing protein [Mycobacteriales bacterium]